MLDAHSIPLRNYLMRHVMPTLTEGLIEVCKIRPEDPVDYLVRLTIPQCTVLYVYCRQSICLKIIHK